MGRVSMKKHGINLLALLISLAAINSTYSAQRAEQIISQAGFEGGVVVHVNCADSVLLSEIHRFKPNSVGHGLSSSGDIEQVRKALFDAGVHGKIGVSEWAGGALPFVPNFVNLLIVDDGSAVSRDEALRVLAPLGTAIIDGEAIVKTRPSEIDDWPQYLYDATGNAVSKDKAIKPPLQHIQWVGSPRWSRHHETMSSVSACVSGGGKVFYILDEGSAHSPLLPCHWKLIARDAFNGTVLWKRDIDQWNPNLLRLKSGPSTLPRRLVVAGDKVFVTLGIEAPVTVIDASTGATLATLKGTEGTEEIVYDAGELFLVVDTNEDKVELSAYPLMKKMTWTTREKRLLRCDAKSGKVIWDQTFDYVAPMTLAKYRNDVYFFDGEQVVALSVGDGVKKWVSDEMPVYKNMPTFFAPKLVVQGGRVMFTGGGGYQPHKGSRGTLHGLSIETGETEWTAPNPASGYQSPEDLFIIKGKAWAGDVTSHEWNTDESKATGEFTGVNIASGTVDKSYGQASAYWFHHRCYMAKATEDYLLTSRTGIEFLDLETGKWTLHHWVRGACLYGIMPANGMVYAPPHPCGCYMGAKMFGFTALATKDAAHPSFALIPDAQRLVKTTAQPLPERPVAKKTEWPTYRGDIERSGSAAVVQAPTKRQWSVKLSDDLTPPVIADRKVVVSLKDQHAVVALDAVSGKIAWRFIPGGNVDSPPALYKGRAYFGCADGLIYCLNLTDGALVWKYQAAPTIGRHMFFERLESTHPVHGNALVMNDKVYTVAGRSMFVDGGIRFLILDAASGRKLTEHIMGDKVPGTDEELQMRHEILNMPVALTDLLSSQDDKIFMRYQQFDMDGNRLEIGYDRKLFGKTRSEVDVVNKASLEDQKGEDAHLFAGTGFLDDSWWHRTYWIYGKHNASGWQGHTRAGASGAPAGRIMSFDDDALYVWGRFQKYFKWTTKYEYSLHAKGYDHRQKWGVVVPILVKSMALTGDKLHILGPDEVVRQEGAYKSIAADKTQRQMVEQEAALLGQRGSKLLTVDTKTGKIIAAATLDSAPEFDAMAAAYGNLYVSMMDGTLRCLGGEGQALDTMGTARVAAINEAGVIRRPSVAARKKR